MTTMRRHDDDPSDERHLSAVDVWATRHGGKIIGIVVYTLSMWFALQKRVDTVEEKKLDAKIFSTYVIQTDTLLRALLTEIREMRTEQQSQHRYLCRGKEEQMGCQP